MIALWVVSGVLLLNILLTAFALWVGYKWRRTPRGSAGRSLLVAVLIGTVPPLVQLGGLLFHIDDPVVLWSLLGGAVGSVVFSWVMIRLFFGGDWNNALAVWLPTLFPGFGVAALLIFVVEPYVVQGFIVPSHSMAPALLGPHMVGPCPDGPGIATIPVSRPGAAPANTPVAICHESKQVRPVLVLDGWTHGPSDQFIADKTRAPNRWDIVVFKSPDNPEQLLVKRLVGLPGERVEIRDGEVLIDGEVAEKPPELAGVEYQHDNIALINRAVRDEGKLWFGGQAVQLGPDEVVVLGDLVQLSEDSRVWGPIPKSDIVGVAAMIYWPPGRWRVME